MPEIRLKENAGTQAVIAGVPSCLQGLLWARGIRSADAAREFLFPDRKQLLSPMLFRDMEKALELLREAKEKNWQTVVYGDYDVDGVCAAALLSDALEEYGLTVDTYLPDRHKEGYGLNTPAVEKLAESHTLMLTVDCGITSVSEIARAKELGMRVILTDHHHPGETLPAADAVISPVLHSYPFPYLCGAATAWKLALALLGDAAEKYIDLACLATVADLVNLTGENRVIVALGLKALENTCRPGLRELMRLADIGEGMTSEKVAFQLAPRLNACGRMETAFIALEMLRTRDEDMAREYAKRACDLNLDRRNQEERVVREAEMQVRQMNLTACCAIVVRGDEWNSGVCGLAAGKLAEKYCYPTVALAAEGENYVGSARTAGNIDLYAALDQCRDLFLRFGGHKQAAGMTMPKENLPEFAERFSEAVRVQVDGHMPRPEILCDAEMTLDEVTEETVNDLRLLEPCGMGNPAPVFLCRDAEAVELRAVGSEGKHVKCTFRQEGRMRGGIYFGGGEWAGRQGFVRMAFTPSLNAYNGRVSVQCQVQALQWEEEKWTEDPVAQARAFLREGGGALPITEEVVPSLVRQGTLLVCRCAETAKRMRALCPETVFLTEDASDPRAYAAVLLYGTPGRVSPYYHTVILCDGDAGETEGYLRQCPGAMVYALPMTQGGEEALARMYLGADELRECYKTLRGQSVTDAENLAELQGIRTEQALFALRVLCEIGLIEYTPVPFSYRMIPKAKHGPEESVLYQKCRRAKGE